MIKREPEKTSSAVPPTHPPLDDTLYLCATKTLARKREDDILNGSGILFGYRALSLQEFLREVFRQRHPQAKILSEEAQRILLSGIMDRSPYDFRCGDYLSRFITEVKLSLIPPGKIFQAGKDFPSEGQKRLEQLEAFFSEYAGELKKHDFKDKSDILLLALDVLNDQSRNIDLLKDKCRVVIEGLSEDHRLWYWLIAGLSRRIPVEVRLPFAVSDKHDFPPAAAIISSLELMAGRRPRLTIHYSEPISLKYIEQDRKRVVVTYADKRYREVEGIGRQIRKLLGGGVSPPDIGVGLRDLSVYGPILTDIFDRYRIPLTFRRGNPIKLNPAVKAAVLPLTVIKSGFDSLNLLRLLRCDYFPFGYGDRLRGLFETAGAVKGNRGYYQKKILEVLEAENAEVNGWDCFQKLDSCMELLEGLIPDRSLEDFVADYRGLLKKFDFFSRGYIDRGLKTQDRLDWLKRDMNCLKALETLLDELSQGSKTFLGDKRVSFERFYELMTFLLGNVTAQSETDSELSGVRVFNLLDLTGMKFEYLFVGGLKEGEYPGMVSDNPLFPDREKTFLRKVLKTTARLGVGKVFVLMEERWEQEYLGFCLSVSAAGNSLFLSYWGDDEEDDQSPFLKEFLDAFRGRVENRVVPRTLTGLDYRQVYQDFELEVKLAHDYKSSFSDPLSSAIFARLKGDPEFLKIIQVAFPNLGRYQEQIDFSTGENSNISPCLGKLEAHDLRQGIIEDLSDGDRFPVSPTSLEIYADCPQRFFLKKILEVPGAFSLDWEADPLIEGSLIHQLMEKCGKLTALFIRKGAKDRQYLEEQWKKIISKELSQTHDLPGTGDQRLRGVRDRLTVERVLNNLRIDWDRLLENQLTPTWFERDFEINTKINLDFGKELSLIGRIDRLDAGEGKLTVIDYKNSKSTPLYKEKLSHKKLGKITLQLPVYLLAALNENQQLINYLEAGFQLIISGDLVSISTDPAKKNYWSLEELETMVGFRNGKMVLEEENLLGRIKILAEGMAAGNFQPLPAESDTCEFCDYRIICWFS